MSSALFGPFHYRADDEQCIVAHGLAQLKERPREPFARERVLSLGVRQ